MLWSVPIAAADAPITVGDGIPKPLTLAGGSAETGRQLFVARDGGHCILCHQVNSLKAPFQGNVGPDLSAVGNRLTPSQLRLRIVDASTLNADTIMPPYYRTTGLRQVAEDYQGRTALSAVQIEHLVAYLSQLREEIP